MLLKFTVKMRTPTRTEILKRNFACIINENASLTGIAKRYGINVMTLKRYTRAKKVNFTRSDISRTSNYRKYKVFNATEEISLK